MNSFVPTNFHSFKFVLISPGIDGQLAKPSFHLQCWRPWQGRVRNTQWRSDGWKRWIARLESKPPTRFLDLGPPYVPIKCYVRREWGSQAYRPHIPGSIKTLQGRILKHVVTSKIQDIHFKYLKFILKRILWIHGFWVNLFSGWYAGRLNYKNLLS